MKDFDRNIVNDYKEDFSKEYIKKLLNYDKTDATNLHQALLEKEFYTTEEMTTYINRKNKFSHSKKLSEKTIYNNALTLAKGINKNITETDLDNYNRLMSLVKRYVRKSDLDANPPKTIMVDHTKKYSYFFLLALSAIFKERSTKSIDQISMESLSKAWLTKTEIHKLFLRDLNKDVLSELESNLSNELKAKVLNNLDYFENDIYLRQRRLKNHLKKIIKEYRNTSSLKEYLHNIDESESYVSTLKELLKMADNNVISNNDVVRFADMLTHRHPSDVIKYAKKVSKFSNKN